MYTASELLVLTSYASDTTSFTVLLVDLTVLLVVTVEFTGYIWDGVRSSQKWTGEEDGRVTWTAGYTARQRHHHSTTLWSYQGVCIRLSVALYVINAPDT